MSRNAQPLHVAFTATPEIYATDSKGAFVYPLTHEQGERLDTHRFDEMRFVVSVWHPREGKNIDLDKAYLELRANFAENGHWTRLAELEPVVSPYQRGETFDGWIVLPVLSGDTALRLHGGGFQPRARVQIRASAYFVA
ncbi:MAG: hypothetical protein OXG83_16965 [Acidobacteria bacterium]|nr:hypothetical protein [Acidobacteriota bacterium]